MAEIEIREERLKQFEQSAREKQEKKRRNQLVNQGFSGGGRPQSAAGRRGRAQKTVNPPNPIDGVSVGSGKTTPSGIANPAFDEPDIEEIITNIPTKQESNVKTPQIKRVEIISTLNEGIDEIKISDTHVEPVEMKGAVNEIEEVDIKEPIMEKKTKEKPRKKPRKKPTTPEFIPTEKTELISNVTPIPERENSSLGGGDEISNSVEEEGYSLDLNSELDNSAAFQPVEPEIQTSEFRPPSRISIQTTAGSAGIEDLESFVFQPAPQDDLIKCRITRSRKGIDNRAYPVYYLHLEREGMKKVFLLGARKRKKTATSCYVLSTDPTDVSRKTDSCVAKLKSNMMGTRFTCFDSGKAYSEPGALINPELLRKEMVTIGYETNVLGFKGPRRMTVVVPGMDLDGERVECQPTNDKETLSSKIDSKNTDNITILQNKSPVWNEDSQSYVLNFHGRVTQASVKNFQIVHEKEPDYIVLQFGRVEDDVFTMDYKYPLCAVQAFSIALSSFDNKLACE